MRQHHLLVEQADDVAIGLQHRRALAAKKPRLHLPHEAGEERRKQEHQRHLRALHGEIEDHGHSASTSSSVTSVAKTSDR